MNNKAASLTPEQALAELEARYEASVTALRKAIGDYIDHNTLPDTEARAEGLFCLSAALGLLTAPIIKPSKRAPGDVSPMPGAIPPPSPIRNCSATICWNS
jgi:hypothetical protein